MKNTANYMDDLRLKLGVDSDFKAMNALGVNHRTQVSRWRKLHGTFDDPLCELIAETLEIDPAEVILAMAIQREKNASIRAVWERIATQMMAVAAGLAVFYFVPGITLHDLDASNLAMMGATLPADAGLWGGTVYYVKWFIVDALSYWYILAPLAALALYGLRRIKTQNA